LVLKCKMINKKTFGWIFLIVAIFIINPIPGLDDIVTLNAYSIYSGADISPSNLSSIYMDYLIWCFVVGFILLVLAMWLLGWDLKRLMRKLDLGKYKITVLLAIGVVALVAYLDISGMVYWASFSSAEAYTNGLQGPYFWEFFKTIVFSIFLILPIAYYFLVHKDFSESISIFTSSYLAWMFGFADVLYFVFQRLPIPDLLPHLNNHPVIGWISSTLGFETVTNLSLVISVVIGFLLIFVLNKVLKEKF